MRTILYLLLNYLILINFFIYCYDEINFEGLLNIRLEHCLSYENKDTFTERGNITIHGGITTVKNLPLSANEKTELELLANEDKFYRLKATVMKDGTELTFLTSIKACMLIQAELNDYLTVSLDHLNNVVGISIGVQSSIACQGTNTNINKYQKFFTKIYVIPITTGPIPDTASYIQKLEREREAKERGEVKDNRSFLAKYWMYIVPVVILMVLSSAANPEGVPGAGGRQG